MVHIFVGEKKKQVFRYCHSEKKMDELLGR